MEFFCDAASGDDLKSGPYWAFMFDDISVAGPFKYSFEHIFFMELRAALHTLLVASVVRPKELIILGTDNSAAMFAIRSGHSGNQIADEWLSRFYRSIPRSFFFHIAHISTLINPVDCFTRPTTCSTKPTFHLDIQGQHACGRPESSILSGLVPVSDGIIECVEATRCSEQDQHMHDTHLTQ